MKISICLNIVLVIATVALSVAMFSDRDPVFDNIMGRSSIRSYQDKPVEDVKIEKMLRAAMAAPTAGNKQPWKFVVIKERKTLDTISGHFNTIKMAKDAPVAIVVCGDLDNTFPGDGRDYWVQDASAATENLLLAAHGMGLGAVWCGIYPMSERVSFLQELLQLPANVVPLNVIPVGYPAEKPKPKNKWKPENIHYGYWNGKLVHTP